MVLGPEGSGGLLARKVPPAETVGGGRFQTPLRWGRLHPSNPLAKAGGKLADAAKRLRVLPDGAVE